MLRYLALLLLLAGACATATLPSHAPTLAGPIVALRLDLPAVRDRPNIHVRPRGDECGIVFALEPRTTIRARTDDGRLVPAAPDDLVIGRSVRAWARGVVLESCPGQATAAAVELLP